MPLVLSERDYKLVTMITKIFGVFTFAAGLVQIVDFQRAWLGLALVALGTIVTLAPVPMTVLRPDSYDAVDAVERDGELVLNE